jgi:transcriptional antiterminator RfaH
LPRLAGYTTYLPRLRQHRVSRGRRLESTPALFPGYCFVLIQMQWHAARWAPGVTRIVLDGATPAKVPDAVIAEIRSRERGGLPAKLRRGDAVRVLRGPFEGRLALYQEQTARERVAVLLALLGGRQRVTLPGGRGGGLEGLSSDVDTVWTRIGKPRAAFRRSSYYILRFRGFLW